MWAGAAVVLTGAMSGTRRTYASPAAIFADASASAALTALTWLSVASPMTFLMARVTAASIDVGVLVLVDDDQPGASDGDGLLGLLLDAALDLPVGDLADARADDRADRRRDEERRREEADDEAGPTEGHRALLDDVVVLLDLHRAVQALADDDQPEQRSAARLDGLEVFLRGVLGQVAPHQDVDGLLCAS